MPVHNDIFLYLYQTEIAAALVEKGGINQEHIVILSPYNAQVADIKQRLIKLMLPQITVCTITKSQGKRLQSFPFVPFPLYHIFYQLQLYIISDYTTEVIITYNYYYLYCFY